MWTRSSVGPALWLKGGVMSEKTMPERETIRLLFELDRVDDPQLYDDLIRFKKGTKRINRLRLLAREGVLGQLGLAAGGVLQRVVQVSAANVSSAEPPSRPAIPMPLASEVFGEPITDR